MEKFKRSAVENEKIVAAIEEDIKAGMNGASACKKHGMLQSWFYQLRKRYKKKAAKPVVHHTFPIKSESENLFFVRGSAKAVAELMHILENEK